MHLFNLRAGAGEEEVLVQIVCAFCFSIWAGAVMWKAAWLIPLLAHVLLNATAWAESNWVSIAVSIVVLIDGVLLMKGDCVGHSESGAAAGSADAGKSYQTMRSVAVSGGYEQCDRCW